MLICDWNLAYFKVNGINDHSLHACIIPTFSNKCLKLKLHQIFSVFKLISNNFLGEKYMSKKNHKRGNQNQVHEVKTFQNLKYEQILRT